MWYEFMQNTTSTATLVGENLIAHVVTCTKCEGSGRHRTPCRACAGEKTVTKTVPCSACKGHKHVTTYTEVPCSCGTGVIRWEGADWPHKTCGGTGRIKVKETKACSTCSGVGTLEITVPCGACKGAGMFEMPGPKGRCFSCDGEGIHREMVDRDSELGMRLEQRIREAGEMPLGSLGEVIEEAEDHVVVPETVKASLRAKLAAKRHAQVLASVEGLTEAIIANLPEAEAPADVTMEEREDFRPLSGKEHGIHASRIMTGSAGA